MSEAPEIWPEVVQDGDGDRWVLMTLDGRYSPEDVDGPTKWVHLDTIAELYGIDLAE